MQVNDTVTISGPAGSANLGKTGVVVSTTPLMTTVRLDGEERLSNFATDDVTLTVTKEQ